MRVVIMSLGSIGQRHLRNLRMLLPDAAIAVWRRPGVDAATPPGANQVLFSLDEVLAFAPDAAIIASPASAHLNAALALADAGVHLLVEKPLSSTGQGVSQLVALCRERNLVLMVGYNLRFMPSLQKARAMIQEGAIGRVISVRAEVGQYLPQWRPSVDYREVVTAQSALGGGVLLELSHDIDYILWILGLPARLTAFGGHYSDLEIDVEDVAEILLDYPDRRCLVSIHLDMVQRSAMRRCRFVGSEGVLIWDCIADQIEYFRADEAEWRVVGDLRLEDRNRMYIDQLAHFFDCIETGRSPLCSGEDGLRSLEIVDATRRSILDRQAVEFDWSNLK